MLSLRFWNLGLGSWELGVSLLSSHFSFSTFQFSVFIFRFLRFARFSPLLAQPINPTRIFFHSRPERFARSRRFNVHIVVGVDDRTLDRRS